MSIFGLAHVQGAGTETTLKQNDEKPAFVTVLEAAATPAESDAVVQLPVEIDSVSTVSADADSFLFLTRLWNTRSDKTIDASSPSTFVHSISSAANRAAEQLGTSSAAIVAIAALETGWGKHIVTSDNGASSHNLFGIKSTDGNLATTTFAQTTEFINGVKNSLNQPFRTYNNANDSIADFARFIQSNPRYSQALSHAQDANAFIDHIHLAGYATDPDYASKVKSVMAQVEKIMLSGNL